jgi:hypothetical protein
MIERPQDTGCTTIEVDADGTEVGAEGVTNGIVSMLSTGRHIEYDEERDAYVVGEPK